MVVISSQAPDGQWSAVKCHPPVEPQAPVLPEPRLFLCEKSRPRGGRKASERLSPVSVLWLGNPVELPGLVFGEVPGASHKFKMIHWCAMIILRRKLAGYKPWWIGHAMVGHDVACGCYPHHNVVILNFDDNASATFPIPRQITLLISQTPRLVVRSRASAAAGDKPRPRDLSNGFGGSVLHCTVTLRTHRRCRRCNTIIVVGVSLRN